MYMSRPKAAVLSAAWANRPSASVVGNLFFATDVGQSGGLFQSNGTSWVPVAPILLGGSGVAASVTGTTDETALATVSVPAGTMGLSGAVEIRTTWTYTNSANSKNLRVRFGGIAGTQYGLIGVTTTATLSDVRRIRNRASASSQVSSATSGLSTPYGTSSSAIVTSSINTASAVDVSITGQLTNTGETITLEQYEVWLLP
jgi:hypothetical protein